MVTIFIEGLTVLAKHGVYPEEREREQRFVVSVWVMLGTKSAGRPDLIEATYNYEMLRETIIHVCSGESVSLLETLANSIADNVFMHQLASEVTIEIRKPDVWKDCVPGVKITRHRI